MDIEELEKMELQVKTILEAHAAFQIVNTKYKSSDIHKICDNCKWKDKCTFFLMKM